MRISEFKSTFDKFGGPSQSNLFQVTISGYPEGINSLMSSKDLTFFCKTAQIPSVSLNVANYEAVASLPKQFPMSVQNTQVNTIFMVDSDHEIMKFFHSWMQSVINIGTSGGNLSEVDGKLPYEIGYKDEYSCRLTIRHFATDGDPSRFYEVILDKAWPSAIGDLDLSWESNDSYLTLPVAFSYDRIEYSGLRPGSPTSRLGRGAGFFQILGAVAGFAGVARQTMQQGFRGDSIQDTINRFQRVNNSMDILTRSIGL
jgi:hypothetical protein